MPAKKRGAAPKESTKPVNDGGLQITCADGCGATSQMVLDRGSPHKGATISDEGWAVLNSPEDKTISFLCPGCFNKLEIDDMLDEDDESGDLKD